MSRDQKVVAWLSQLNANFWLVINFLLGIQAFACSFVVLQKQQTTFHEVISNQ
jgi:hypothetical protein